MLQALFLAFLCDVDYKEEFRCNDDLSNFTNMINSNGGSSETRVNVEYKGSALHPAMMVPISYFDQDLQKRLVTTVKKNWTNIFVPASFMFVMISLIVFIAACAPKSQSTLCSVRYFGAS